MPRRKPARDDNGGVTDELNAMLVDAGFKPIRPDEQPKAAQTGDPIEDGATAELNAMLVDAGLKPIGRELTPREMAIRKKAKRARKAARRAAEPPAEHDVDVDAADDGAPAREAQGDAQPVAAGGPPYRVEPVFDDDDEDGRTIPWY